jgi:hypothetical protein
MLWTQRPPNPARQLFPAFVGCACLGVTAVACALDAMAMLGPAMCAGWFGLLAGPKEARKHDGTNRNVTFLALIGSCAALLACRQMPALPHLLSDLAQKGPEYWRTARVQSPPDVFHALQRCARADTFHGLATSAERRLSGATGTLGFGPLGAMIRLLAWRGSSDFMKRFMFRFRKLSRQLSRGAIVGAGVSRDRLLVLRPRSRLHSAPAVCAVH